MATNRSPWTVLRYIVMALFAVTSFYPFFWIVINSVKSNDEIMGKPFALPTALHLENYVVAWKTAKIGTYFFNSLLVAVCAVLIVILVGSMASYVLARVSKSAGSTAP